MNTIKKSILLGLSLVTISNSWAQSLVETSKEIEAQTTIVRGDVDNLIDQMNQNKADALFNTEDYVAQSLDYKNKAETALANFENVLEKDILVKAAFLMNQYNSIYTSSSYSKEQKYVLLADRKLNIIKQFEVLTKEYQKALKDVYSIVPHTLGSYTMKTIPEKYSFKVKKDFKGTFTVELVYEKTKLVKDISVSWMKLNDDSVRSIIYDGTEIFDVGNGLQGVYWGHYPGVAFAIYSKREYLDLNLLEIAEYLKVEETLRKKLYDNVFYPSFKGSCKSISCIGLRTGDYSNLVSMIKKLLDRDMDLTLADGTKLKIKGLDQRIDNILHELSRINYPENLPFDL